MSKFDLRRAAPFFIEKFYDKLFSTGILHEVRKCESWSIILNGNKITFYKPVEYIMNPSKKYRRIRNHPRKFLFTP